MAYVALALATIAIGLLVHQRGEALPPALRDVLGDALWAAMVAWWIGALRPAAALRDRGLVALALCLAVEASQLVRAPLLDAIRATRAGHLVLGSSFDARDLVAYAAGVLAAVLLERAIRRPAMGRPGA